MPPNRRAAAPVSVLASIVGVTGAGIFAVVEGSAAALGAGEPLLVGACIAGIGYIFLALAREIVAIRDMAIKTHDGLFDPERGVLHLIAQNAARADRQDHRLARHSDALRAAELLRD